MEEEEMERFTAEFTYRVGRRLLEKMGWTRGEGLGAPGPDGAARPPEAPPEGDLWQFRREERA
eukprot:1109090-Pyramimonas_sp.AAC.1